MDNKHNKEKDMAVRMIQILICAGALISLQGCFSFHSTTVRDNPPSQTTTVYPVPAGDAVAVTTNH
jgi:hypothetical protein